MSKGQIDRTKGKSPYVRYDKKPFPYSYRRCEHKNWVTQITPTWGGKVCGNCGSIMMAFERRK